MRLLRAASPAGEIPSGTEFVWRHGRLVAKSRRRRLPWQARVLTRLVWWSCLLLAGVTVLLARSSAGRWRHHAAPVWVAVGVASVAVACGRAGVSWLPALAAVAAGAWLWWGSARVLDRRVERAYAVVVALVAGAWASLAAVSGSTAWTVGAWPVLTVACSAPWWRHYAWWLRRPPAIVARWAEDVAPHLSELVGSELTHVDEDAGTAVLRLRRGAKASLAARLDEDVEGLLDQPRGTVTLAADPRLSVREVRVAFTKPGDGGRMRFWDGPTLGRDGRYVTGHAAGGLAVHSRLWRPNGATCHAVIGPPGSGKGGYQRLLALTAALSPDVEILAVDGKGGAGIPEVAGGCRVYATTPGEWSATIAAAHAVMEARRARYGEARRSRWRPGPGEPLLLLMVDEARVVVGSDSRTGRWLLDLTGQGRSLGVGVCVAAQRGEGDSYGGTEVRANILNNGALWAGPATDGTAANVMLQGHSVSLDALPNEPGWCFVLGSALGDQPTVPSRTLWVPSAQDVEDGMEAPFGVIEEWLARDTVHPVLAVEDEAALAEALVDVPDGDEAAHSVVPAPREAPARAAVWAVLVDAEAPLQRSEIASLAARHLGKPLSPRHTSDILSALAADGRARRVEGQRWLAAA